MDYKEILILVGEDLQSTQGLEPAIKLGCLMQARLIGLHLPMDGGTLRVAGTPGEPTPPSLGSEGAVMQSFLARCSQAALSIDWVEDHGSAAERLTFHGRCADLIVVGRDDASTGGALSPRALGQLLLGASAPVLVIPSGKVPGFPPRRVLVAWNDRRESARAVRDALPLLRRAHQTTLLTVRPSGFATPPAGRVLSYLHAHGVHAEVRINLAKELEAPCAILAQADALNADLIVSGAYGHSRAFEQVLGGVTRHLLDHSAVPLLMAH